MIYALLIAPFETLGFMRAALVACIALALANGVIGTMLVLRQMSFDGDVLGHAVMPGAAIGFLYAGPSPAWLSAGGLASGLRCRRAVQPGCRRTFAPRRRAGGILPRRPFSGRSAGGVARQQRRCHARAVWHRAGDRSAGAGADCDDRQRDPAGGRRAVPAVRGGRLRRGIPACVRYARAVPSGVRRPGGAGTRRQLPGVRHAAGAGTDAVAGRRFALLGVGRGGVDGAGDRIRRACVGRRPADLVSRQSPVGTGDRAGGWRHVRRLACRLRRLAPAIAARRAAGCRAPRRAL